MLEGCLLCNGNIFAMTPTHYKMACDADVYVNGRVWLAGRMHLGAYGNGANTNSEERLKLGRYGTGPQPLINPGRDRMVIN